MMRWALVGLLVVHGLLHGLGFVKAFGFAELPQLTQPISREWGLVWLLAGLFVVAAAIMLASGIRSYWIVGGVAVVVSQAAIGAAWGDAWAGSVPNALLLVVVAHGLLTEGPWSFRTQYVRDVQNGLARSADAPLITEADLAALPAPVRRYLRVSGALGQARVQNYRVRFTGRIRRAPAAAWMPFEAEQQSFADEPARFFLMRGRLFGIPLEAFHRMTGGHATMQVKIAGLVPMVDARGDEMDRAETVTLFNDMCVFAPGTLVGPQIAWEPIDASSARARFTDRGRTIAATLFFDAAGRLVNFESDDRARSSPDGTFTNARFSTPLREYRDFGPLHLAGYGEARWRLPDGEFTYGEFTMNEVAINVRERLPAGRRAR